MAFLSVVLNEVPDWGFECGPAYSTELIPLENGFEEAQSNWKYPQHRASANFDALPDDKRDTMLAAIHVCRGKRHAFKFRDWNDYVVEDEPLAVAGGTTAKVQLYRRYDFGPAWLIRPIQAIEFATIYDENGDPVPGTLDLDLGEFTPDEAWGAGPYTWSGQFYLWMRFDKDYNPITLESWMNNSVKIELYERKRKITATNLPLSWEE